MARFRQCAYCGEPVNTDAPGYARQVVGWEVVRSGGGANQVRRRVEMGKVAHTVCLEEVEQQQSLW